MTFGYFSLKKKKERKNGRGSNFKIIEKKNCDTLKDCLR